MTLMQFLCMLFEVSRLIEDAGTRDFIILKKGLTLTPCCICGALARMLLASRILVRHLSRVVVGWDESAASLSLFRGAMPHKLQVWGTEKLAVSNQNAPLQKRPPIPPCRAKSKYDSPQPESGLGEKVLRFDLGMFFEVSRLIEAHRGRASNGPR